MPYLFHEFISAAADLPDATAIRPSNWNAKLKLGNSAGTAPSASDAIVSANPILSLVDSGGVGDGATDNSTAITDWLASGEEYLYVPTGTFAFTDSTVFNITGTTIRRIFGPGVLKYTGVGNQNQCYSVTDYTGDGIVFDGLTFDVSNTNVNSFVFTVYGATLAKNITFQNCYFPNSSYAPFSMETGTIDNITIDGCQFESFNQAGIRITCVNTNLRITNNTFLCGLANVAGPTIYIEQPNYITISGNRIDRSNNFSISLISSKNSIISNNILTNSGLDVIRIDGIDGYGDGVAENFLISNNIIDFPNTASGDMAIGVGAFLTTTGGTAKNGMISGNYINSTGGPGIALSPIGNGTLIQDVVCHGNFIIDPNQLGLAGSASGIFLSGTGTGSILRFRSINDVIRSNDGNAEYGVQEASSSDFCDVIYASASGVTIATALITGANSRNAPIVF